MPGLHFILFELTALISDGMTAHGNHWQYVQIVPNGFDLWFTSLSALIGKYNLYYKKYNTLTSSTVLSEICIEKICLI